MSLLHVLLLMRPSMVLIFNLITQFIVLAIFWPVAAILVGIIVFLFTFLLTFFFINFDSHVFLLPSVSVLLLH